MRKATMKKMGMAIIALAALAGLSGCYGDGGYGQAWYDVYGNYCGSGTPGPGCNFYYDGSKISATQDPYYVPGGNSLSYGTWSYYDSYGYSQVYTGWGWLSPDGILYTDSGAALNNDEDKDSRDLITDVAAREQEVVTTVGKNFAQKYALAEATGIQIARTLNDWATLSKKQNRARTEQDVADFSKRLYGLNVDTAKNALDKAKAGDTSALESANGEVAAYWGTSPETAKTILKTWYKDQLADLHVK